MQVEERLLLAVPRHQTQRRRLVHRHRRHPRPEGAVDIQRIGTALRRPLVVVVRPHRQAPVILQRERARPVAVAGHPVTAVTRHRHVRKPPSPYPLLRQQVLGRTGRQRNRRDRLIRLRPPIRVQLDELDDRLALPVRKQTELRHRAALEPLPQRPVQVRIQRQLSVGRRAELEDPRREVARLDHQPSRRRPLPVPVDPVTPHAVARVNRKPEFQRRVRLHLRPDPPGQLRNRRHRLRRLRVARAPSDKTHGTRNGPRGDHSNDVFTSIHPLHPHAPVPLIDSPAPNSDAGPAGTSHAANSRA